jgi:hypothetical protein
MSKRPCTQLANAEWRINTRFSEIFANDIYHDLFYKGKYHHVWIRHSKITGQYELATYDQTLGKYDTFAEAEAHIAAVIVARRFREASH